MAGGDLSHRLRADRRGGAASGLSELPAGESSWSRVFPCFRRRAVVAEAAGAAALEEGPGIHSPGQVTRPLRARARTGDEPAADGDERMPRPRPPTALARACAGVVRALRATSVQDA